MKQQGICSTGIYRNVSYHVRLNAGLTQLVECQLPKLNVASSNLVLRSIFTMYKLP